MGKSTISMVTKGYFMGHHPWIFCWETDGFWHGMMGYWVDVQKTSRVDLSIFLLGYTWIYYILTMIIYDLWWFLGILDRISSWDFEGLMEILLRDLQGFPWFHSWMDQHLDMKFTSGFMDMLIEILYIYIFTGGWIHLVMDLSRGRPFFIWDLYDWGL